MNSLTIPNPTDEQRASLLAQLQGAGGQPQPQPQPTNPGQPDPGKPPEVPVGEGTQIIDLPWNSGGERTKTRDHGGFGPGQIKAFKFRTGPYSTRGAVVISASEYDAAPVSRRACISKVAGDFDNPIVNNMARAESAGLGSVTINVWVGAGGPGLPILEPDTEYFFNVRGEEGQSGEMQVYISNPS